MEIPATNDKMNGRKISVPPRRGEVKAAIFKKLLKSVVMLMGDLGKKIGNCLISPDEDEDEDEVAKLNKYY
ncbi:hypothetical protein KY290_029240 [Solanum tuberosum]|uniref:Uncharacterized protein n=1 Tax=Solanum tuberosum TaxID=4113 RepID=A0ABQ7UM67_SOLTU|nr:hypothetical protein KY289_028427 [Solanum tuberosum]KAH0663316.1 hypothetical protein KY284_028247 [Solanum tuberosum]KAH0750008.1 hypothetical protein KY290_029240 [Solanum tuberosum]